MRRVPRRLRQAIARLVLRTIESRAIRREQDAPRLAQPRGGSQKTHGSVGLVVYEAGRQPLQRVQHREPIAARFGEPEAVGIQADGPRVLPAVEGVLSQKVRRPDHPLGTPSSRARARQRSRRSCAV